MPDGQSIEFSGAQIGTLAGAYAIWELYEFDGTSTVPGQFGKLWADSRPYVIDSAVATRRDIALAVTAMSPMKYMRKTAQYRPSVTETISFPTGTAAEMLGTGGVQISRVSGVVPPSGDLVIRVKGYVTTADARSLFWNVVDTDTGSTVTSRRIIDGAEAAPQSKWIDEEFLLGGTSGQVRNFAIHQLAGGTGTPATYTTAGQNPSRPITVEFIPVN
jgi:hypothetical protein